MSVSVVIPTLNGAATLPALLDALASQEIGRASIDLVAIDSGSTDETLDLLERAGARILRIPQQEFAHGRTRNRAIAATRGELVFLFSQDAVPTSPDYLRRLIATLETYPDAAGVSARQLPRPGANVLAHLRWGRFDSRPRIVRVGPDEFARLSAEERRVACLFHSAAGGLRRSAWEVIPFPDVPIAEDLAWSREVLSVGWALAYEPRAAVWHSHERPLGEELERIRAEAAVEWEFLSRAPVRTRAGRITRGVLWAGGDFCRAFIAEAGSTAKRVAAARDAARFSWGRAGALLGGYRAAQAGKG